MTRTACAAVWVVETMNTTKKLYAYLLTVVFLTSLAPVATTAEIGSSGSGASLAITDQLYQPLPDGRAVFGDGATVFVRYSDPSNPALTEQIDTITGVRARSTTDTTGITFDLMETGPETGVFVGSVLADSTVGSSSPPAGEHAVFGAVFGDGVLRVANGNTITVAFGGVSDTAVWRPAAAAVITTPSHAAGDIIDGYGAKLEFSVVDADLNTNSGAVDSVPPSPTAADRLFVFSDSDPAGEFVRLTESGANTGVFSSLVEFERNRVANNGKVQVQHGDRVQALYFEAADGAGQARVHELPGPAESWTFVATTNGLLLFAQPSFLAADVDGDGLFDAPAVTLIVSDLDESLVSTAAQTMASAVTVSSTTDATTAKAVPVTEVGGLTGLFRGEVSVADAKVAGACAANPTAVCAKHGDTLTATYEEAADQGGQAVTRTATATFLVKMTAEVQLGPHPDVFRLVGALLPHQVQVFDLDSNRNPVAVESITVQVKSSTDPTSLAVTLTEIADPARGRPAENSGLFRGSFQVSDTASAGTLRVTDRDLIVADYHDPLQLDGFPGRVQSERTTWRAATDAQVFLDSDSYVKRVAQNLDFGISAGIVVIDQDQNDPFRVDEIDVSLVASPQGHSTTNIARETGPDSGVFVAEMPLGAQGTVAPGTGNGRFDPALAVAGIHITPGAGLITDENGRTATFEVVLTAQPTADVSFDLRSSDLTEGDIDKASLTFTPANWDDPQEVTVTGVDDSDSDGDVQYMIVTDPVTSTDSFYSGTNPSDVQVTNRGARIIVTGSPVTTEDDDPAEDTFNVALSMEPSSAVTIPVVSTNTDEGTLSTGAVVLDSTNWEDGIDVTVTSVDDSTVDGDVAYIIEVGEASCTGCTFNGIDPSDVLAVNADDDESRTHVVSISVSASTITTTENQATPTTFTVSLNRPPIGGSVEIPLVITDASEAEFAGGDVKEVAADCPQSSAPCLVFGPTEDEKKVHVRGLWEGAAAKVLDGNIAYGILLGPAVTDAADPVTSQYNDLPVSDVLGTNLDIDQGVVFGSLSGTSSESGGAADFTVRLSKRPANNEVITVGFTTSDASEATVSPASMDFTTANWQNLRTLRVQGVDDSVIDGNIRSTVFTTVSSNQASTTNFPLWSPSDLAVVNINNELVTFRAEFRDPVAADGSVRAFASADVNWFEGPDVQALRFEDPLNGKRVNREFLTNAGEGRDTEVYELAAYGSFGNGRTVHVSSNRCSHASRSSDDNNDEIVTLTPDPLNPNRYRVTLTVTREIGFALPLQSACRNTGTNTISVNANDVVRIASGGVQNMDQLTISALPTPVHSLIDAQGNPVSVTELFGLDARTGVRVESAGQNRDVTGRDVGSIDVYQEPDLDARARYSSTGGGNNCGSNCEDTAFYPPRRIPVVETGPDTDVFTGSFGFVPFDTVMPPGASRSAAIAVVGPGDPDDGLPLTPLPLGTACATNDEDDDLNIIRTLRPSCAGRFVTVGDFSYGNGRTELPRLPMHFGQELSELDDVPQYIKGGNTGRIYLDVDASDDVTHGDIDMSGPDIVDDTETGTGAATCSRSDCDTGVPVRGPGEPHMAIGGESFFDRNRNGKLDYDEPIYLDVDQDGFVTNGEFRFNRAPSVPDGLVPVANADVHVGKSDQEEVVPTGLFIETSHLATPLFEGDAANDPAEPPITRDSISWFNGADAQIVEVQAGFGVSVNPVVRLDDDRLSGYVLHEQFVSTGQTTFQPSKGTIHANFPLVFVTTRESVNVADGQPHQVQSAATPVNAADEAITDRNRDNKIDCGDVTISGGGGATCAQVDADAGEVTVDCPGSTCSVTITYQYRPDYHTSGFGGLPPSCSPCNRFNYRVDDNTEIVFGGTLPRNDVVDLSYKPVTIPVQVSSLNTGESETIVLRLAANANRDTSYTATIPIETLGVPNNGAVHVAPGANGPRDRIEVTHADNVMADGRAGSANPNNFRSVIGHVDWIDARDGVISFHDATFTETHAKQTSGQFVQIQVTDRDADVTENLDTIAVTASIGGVVTGVELREIASRAGVFRGTVEVAVGGVGSITLEYDDKVGQFGTPTNRRATVDWRPSTTAVVVASDSPNPPVPETPPAASPDIVVKGSDGALYIGIRDSDRNRNTGGDKVELRVTSRSDPLGELIIADETSPGVFQSPGIRFETTLVPNNGKIFARDIPGPVGSLPGEEIRVRFADPVNAAGVRQVIEPAAKLYWDRTFDGAVTLDESHYIGLLSDGASGTIRHAAALVSDGDLNVDPFMPDISTTTLHVGQKASGSDSIVAGTDVTVALIETGANTGNFVGFFSFGTSATPEGGDVTDPDNQVGLVGLAASVLQATIKAEYTDVVNARGTTGQLFADTAEWSAAGVGVIRFDAPGYNQREQVPTVTLIDQDLDTSSAAQTATVAVKSLTDEDGITVQLTEITGRPGFFRGTIGLVEGESTASAIQVADVDTVQAIYNDASPSAPRFGEAAIAIGDFDAPVTSLVTVPAQPNGLRDWFTQDPLITLTTNEAVDVTNMQVAPEGGEFGAELEYQGAFLLADRFGEGAFDIKYWSVDLFGNEEDDPVTTVRIDLRNPNQTVEGLTGVPAPAGAVALNWTSVGDTSNPLEFHEYAIFRDGILATPIGNATGPLFTDTQLTDENPHTYQVAVRDASGRLGPISSAVTVVPDATPPEIRAGTVNPTTFDTRESPGNLTVSVIASDANLAEVTVAMVPPSGIPLVEEVLSGVNGTFSGTLDVSAITQPCTCRLVFEASDIAGNNATLALDYTITGPDTEPPLVEFLNVPANGRLQPGTAIQVRVTDNVGLTSVSWRMDGGRNVTAPVDPLSLTEVTFIVPTVGLPLGAHTLTVEATDTATDLDGTLIPNRRIATASFEIRLGDGNDTLVDSFFLPTTARPRADGAIHVEWEVSDDLLGIGIDGFQVWRSSSPFEEVHRTDEPSQRQFVDDNTTDGQAYRYVATFYTAATGPFASLIDVPGYPGNDDDVPASGQVTAGEAGGLPGWIWVIVIALAILAVAALVAVAIASRRGSAPAQRQETRQVPPPGEARDEEAVDAEAEEEGAVAGETHRLKCPECQHRFEVQGSKPIVTNCPNCGRKGILR